MTSCTKPEANSGPSDCRLNRNFFANRITVSGTKEVQNVTSFTKPEVDGGPRSTAIRTREVLDRERQAMYNLVVIARSNNRPSLLFTAHVQIEV